MINHDPIFFKIAEALLTDYTSVYYVNAVTNAYQWYSVNPKFHSLQIEPGGADFFQSLACDAKLGVYEEDQPLFLEALQKDKLLAQMKKGTMQRLEYRLMIEGKPVYHALHLIRGLGEGDDYFILGVRNVDQEVRRRQDAERAGFEREIFNQIAGSLAAHYDTLYFINAKTSHYLEFSSTDAYKSLQIPTEGDDFFAESQQNIPHFVHPEDRERIHTLLNKDYLITMLEEQKHFSADYRLKVLDRMQYTRMTAAWSSDRLHLIIGVENINDEVKKEREQIQALNQANALARRDELTGTKNKNAYHELEQSMQESLSQGEDVLSFAIVVCDLNNLKLINDTLGHKAGDDYIRAACKLICTVFAHSPVFRIGGDEFVVILRGSDYQNRNTLFESLRQQVRENLTAENQPVIASGMAIFDPVTDSTVSAVFERADGMMYENKTHLKEIAAKGPDSAKQYVTRQIPEDYKKRLDSLFDALSVVAEGAYVYLCNMQYDYSRWSKSAVDSFGLPAEYMYGAGDIWEAHIHPEDRETYHAGISDIFSGKALGHDMQYRARRLDGGYDVCTCRGLVLRDEHGNPTYFGGAIRNHGIQGHIDTLTGLRNQYGFFEDLQSGMIRRKMMRVCLIGISKFSETNEMYGYHFGNRILQKFGRYLFEHIGNTGSVYRLDGTKFAVLSNTLTSEEFKVQYELLRAYFREDFALEDKTIILDLNAGLLDVDNYEVDDQTVYACLNFAYNMSKVRMQGDLVEFYNNLNDENKHRIEKLHAIRASIMQNYSGFFLLYQPVVDAHNEALIGAEALLRWHSEEYGMVPPDHFIPILEKDPFFCDLGRWILKTAIQAAKKILECNSDFVMNVNIAYTQLERNDFVDMVLQTLDETEFPPEHLCLEITERCRLLDMDRLKNVVINLRARGVLIALDDFGTGFSSIGVVKDLPFDIIKIDRSFVLKIEEDEKERELIKSFAGMASTFGAKVCVEGIETEGMRDILQNYSVRSFQGYYYSKPLTLADFLKWTPKGTVHHAE